MSTYSTIGIVLSLLIALGLGYYYFRIVKTQKAIYHAIYSFLVLILFTWIFFMPNQSGSQLPLIISGSDSQDLLIDSLEQVYADVEKIEYGQNHIPFDLSVYKSIVVLTEEITSGEKKYLEQFDAVFLPGMPKIGIREVTHRKEGFSGEELKAWVKVKSHSLGDTLQVVDMYGRKENIPLEPTKQIYEIPLHLNVSGRFPIQFYLRNKVVLDTLESTVSVLPREVQKIFIYAGSVDMELNQLKRGFAELGHQVAMRTVLAPQKYSDEKINGNDTEIPRSVWNGDFLEGIDVLVVRSSEWNGLSSRIKRSLELELSEGLELILIWDEVLESTIMNGLEVTQLEDDIDFNSVELVQGATIQGNRTYASSNHSGLFYLYYNSGNIAVSTLQESWKLHSFGLTQLYQSRLEEMLNTISQHVVEEPLVFY